MASLPGQLKQSNLYVGVQCSVVRLWLMSAVHVGGLWSLLSYICSQCCTLHCLQAHYLDNVESELLDEASVGYDGSPDHHVIVESVDEAEDELMAVLRVQPDDITDEILAYNEQKPKASCSNIYLHHAMLLRCSAPLVCSDLCCLCWFYAGFAAL